VKNVVDEFTWRLVVVYGSPYEEGKDEFINELHDLFTNWSGPTVIGGYFNLVCNQSENVMVLLTITGLISVMIGSIPGPWWNLRILRDLLPGLITKISHNGSHRQDLLFYRVWSELPSFLCHHNL
jgi:hypothetical protein